MKVNLILDIEVRPPVADLRSTPQALDSQHRESELIVDRDFLLILLNESGVRGGRKIMEGPVRDSASGIAHCRNTTCREGDFLGFGMTDDRESNSPGRRKTVSHDKGAKVFSHILEFCSLNKSFIWTQDEQVRFILQSLAVILGSLRWERVCGVCLNGL